MNSREIVSNIAHIYKIPKDEDLLSNLKNNLEYISELEQSIKELIQ